MLGPEYLWRCPELLVTAKDLLEGQTDFLELIWHQWEMTSRDSASNSATQAACIHRRYLLNTGPGLWCSYSYCFWDEEKVQRAAESHRARKLQKQTNKKIPGPWFPEVLTIYTLLLNCCSQQDAEPGLSGLADSESAS